MASKFKDGVRSELYMQKPVYRWASSPADHWTKTMWSRFGYRVRKGAEVDCYVLSGDNSEFWRLYSFGKVVPIAGKKAAARRQVYHQFEQLPVRFVYTALVSILRRQLRRSLSDVDKAFLLLAKLRRLDLLESAWQTHLASTHQNHRSAFFTGWVSLRRHAEFHNRLSMLAIKKKYGG